MDQFVLEDESFMIPYTREVAEFCDPFVCGDADLDEYFKYDVFLYEKELLGKSFCWISKTNQKKIVAIATLSYDGIKTFVLDRSSRNALQRKIPYSKQHRSYPAVLIGRLGVSKEFQGANFHAGSQIIEVLKLWFVDENNKAACRYVIVDAYNFPGTLHFYERNGFKTLYKTESSERDAFGISDEEVLKSRIMYFDLKRVFQ